MPRSARRRCANIGIVLRRNWRAIVTTSDALRERGHYLRPLSALRFSRRIRARHCDLLCTPADDKSLARDEVDKAKQALLNRAVVAGLVVSKSIRGKQIS